MAAKQDSNSHTGKVAALFRLLAIVPSTLGLLALVGWMSGHLVMATFGGEFIPMAPTTALLFLLFGLGALVLPALKKRPGARLAGVILGMAGTLLAVLLLILSSMGIAPGFEHLGMEISGTLAGAPLGHMSPLTAAGFCLAGGGLILLLLVSESRDRIGVGGVLSGGLAAILGAVLTLGYGLGGPLLYDSGMIPPALTTSLGFFTLGSSLASSGIPGPGIAHLRPKKGAFSQVGPILTWFFLCTTGVIITAFFHLRNERIEARSEAEIALDAVVQAKMDQILQWREERVRLLEAAFGDEGFVENLARWYEDPEAQGPRAYLLQELRRVGGGYSFRRISLHHGSEGTWLAFPELPNSEAGRLEALAGRVLDQRGGPVLEFRRAGETDDVELVLFSNLWAETTPVPASAVVFIVEMDPAVSLYRLLNPGAQPSGAGEFYLVAPEGDEVLFLSELRFRTDAPLSFRLSPQDQALPSPEALRNGATFLEGVNYRGRKVFAAVTPVDGSPWYLVAEREAQEIFAPLRENLYLTVGIVALVIFGLGGIVAVAWQRSQKIHLRELMNAEAARSATESRYRTLFRTMEQGVVYQDASGAIQACNPAAERILGLSLSQMRGLTSTDPRWESVREDGSPFPGEEHPAMVALGTGEPVRGVTMGIRDPDRPGTRWILIDAVPEKAPGESTPHQVFTTFTDITELRRVQEQLYQSEQRYRSIFENEDMVMLLIHPESGVILDANPAAERFYGWTREELRAKTIFDINTLSRDEVVGEMRAAFQAEKKVFRFRHRLANGEIRDVEVFSGPVGGRDRPRLFSFIYDITERTRLEEEYRREAELNQELAALSRAFLDPAVNLEQMARLTLESAKRITGSRDGLVTSVDPASGVHVAHAFSQRGWEEFGVREHDGRPELHPGPDGLFGGPWSPVLDRGKGFFVNHTTGGPKEGGGGRESGPAGVFLASPAVIADRARGLVVVAESPQEYSDDDLAAVGRVADVFAAALRHARITGELQESRASLREFAHRIQAVREQEREILGRDLHDELGEVLTAHSMDLDFLRRESAADNPELAERVLPLMESATAALNLVREFCLNLRSPVLDLMGLGPAIQAHVEPIAGRSSSAFHLQIDDTEMRLGPEVEINVFRIAQEALTNVVRHSQAEDVWVRFETGDGKLVLEVADNGVGIPLEGKRNMRSMGLLGMEERALAIGGELTIESPGEGGTVVRLELDTRKR